MLSITVLARISEKPCEHFVESALSSILYQHKGPMKIIFLKINIDIQIIPYLCFSIFKNEIIVKRYKFDQHRFRGGHVIGYL